MSAIPLAAPGPIARAARWTWLVRLVLAAALIVTMVFAFLSSRTRKSADALLEDGRSPIVALDLSWSVSSRNADLVGNTLKTFAESGRDIGLVLFSDSAYEALPPGTSSEALKPFLRIFDGTTPTNPWRATFSAGTRIGAALDRARQMLLDAHITNGSVVLISDLDDSPADQPDLARTLITYENEGIPIRMISINAVPEDVRYFRAALAPGGGTVTAIGEQSSQTVEKAGAAFPTGLVLAAGIIALLLALNEQALGRLTWGRRA